LIKKHVHLKKYTYSQYGGKWSGDTSRWGNGLLSRAAILNPRRIKSIVLPPLASIENSSNRGYGVKDNRFFQDGRRVIKAHGLPILCTIGLWIRFILFYLVALFSVAAEKLNSFKVSLLQKRRGKLNNDISQSSALFCWRNHHAKTSCKPSNNYKEMDIFFVRVRGHIFW
jgi:hypothetical protein